MHQESAFPVVGQEDKNDNPITYAQTGMTLRDYFAAKAMHSYIGFLTHAEVHISQHYKEMAEEAYRIADAMIAERDK